MTYKEQLKTPEWKAKRREILDRDKCECTKCGKKTSLQVHHLKYTKGKLAWEYSNDKLVTLCKTCHEKEHTIVKVKKTHSFTKVFFKTWTRPEYKLKSSEFRLLMYIAEEMSYHNRVDIDKEDFPKIGKVTKDTPKVVQNAFKSLLKKRIIKQVKYQDHILDPDFAVKSGNFSELKYLFDTLN